MVRLLMKQSSPLREARFDIKNLNYDLDFCAALHHILNFRSQLLVRRCVYVSNFTKLSTINNAAPENVDCVNAL